HGSDRALCCAGNRDVRYAKDRLVRARRRRSHETLTTTKSQLCQLQDAETSASLAKIQALGPLEKDLESSVARSRLCTRKFACDDYSSRRIHWRISARPLHRGVSPVALAAGASGSAAHREFLSRDRTQKLERCSRFYRRRLSRSVGRRSGASS